MTAQQLKNAILQEAIQGRLVPQDPNDEPASVLLEHIRKEKQQLVKEGKLKKKDLEEKLISEDEIPFEIPKGWIWCRMSSLIQLLSGQDFSPEKYNSKKAGTPYITGASNISNGKLIINRWTETPSVIGKEGDLLIVCKGSGVGKMCICNIPKIHIARQIQIIRPLSSSVLMDFIRLVVNANLQSIVSKAQGVIPGISREEVLDLFVPLPPPAEQKRIVAKIEELLPKVEEYGNAQEKLNKLNEELPERLKKSILQEAIEGRLVPQDPNDEPASALLAKIREEKKQLVKEGKLKKKDLEENPISEDEILFEIPDSWEWVTLSQISLDSADGPFGSNLKSEHYTTNKEVRIIQLSNIGENGWRDENVKYTTFSHLPSISRSEAFPNDIIIAKMMPAGRAIICPSEDIKYVLSSDAVRFDFSNHLYRKYLYYAINSNIFKNQVYGKVQGITRVRTSLGKLRTYLIPLPPLAEQHRIVEKIEQLFKEIDKLKK